MLLLLILGLVFASFRNEVFDDDEEVICGPGYSVPGWTDRRSAVEDCRICPIGQWKSGSNSQVGCNACEYGYSTVSEGSTNSSDCAKLCDRGFKRNGDTCENCGYGFYSLYYDTSTTCKACQDGWTTRTSRGRSNLHCYPNCPPGQEVEEISYSPYRRCRECKVNYYKSREGPWSCKKCYGERTTNGKGAKGIDECVKKTVCGLGSFRNYQNNECQECPSGKYNPDTDTGTSCYNCEDGEFAYPWDGAGYCCVNKCREGWFLNTKRIKCEKCAIGYYTDKENFQSSCDKCRDGKTNDRIGSTRCNLVTECPENEYLDLIYSQSAVYSGQSYSERCRSCKNGYFKQGSNRITFCSKIDVEDLVCPPGQESRWKTFDNTQKECKPCQRGAFKSITSKYSCISCPDGKTSDFGSTSINDCHEIQENERECGPGYRIQLGLSTTSRCVECREDTYSKVTSTSTECSFCPAGTTTDGKTGSTSLDDCILSCSGGEYLETSSKCTKCPIGYISSGKRVTECTKCSDELSTKEEGSAICDLVIGCFPNRQLVYEYDTIGGKFVSIEGCEDCPYGYEKVGTNRNQCVLYDDDDYYEYYDDDDDYYDDDIDYYV